MNAPLCLEASGKSEMHIIKGLGFSLLRVFTESHGEMWVGIQHSSQAEPDYRSAVRLQTKSFSHWTDCLVRIINHLGHAAGIFFFLELLSNLTI